MAIGKVVKARRDDQKKERAEKAAKILQSVGKTVDEHTGLQLYKVLDPNGMAVHGAMHFQWSLPIQRPDGTCEPGAWMEVSLPLIWCQHGFHVTSAPYHWMYGGADVVWLVEWDGELVRGPGDEMNPAKDREKVAVQKVRLLRRATRDEVMAANAAFEDWSKAEMARIEPKLEELRQAKKEREKREEEERERKHQERLAEIRAQEKEEFLARVREGAKIAKTEKMARLKAGLPSTGYRSIVQSIALLPNRKLSDRDLGYACWDAAKFALQHLQFDPDDFTKLSTLSWRDVGEKRTVWPSLWMDSRIYREAIRHANKSAAIAYEQWKKITPIFAACVYGVRGGRGGFESGRLNDGMRFRHEAVDYRVTSVRWNDGYVNAKKDDIWVKADPKDKSPGGPMKQVPSPDQRVYKFTREELREQIRTFEVAKKEVRKKTQERMDRRR